GKYVAADLDAFVYSRYANYILEHGKAMAQDMFRYAPLGHPDAAQLAVENGFPYFQVILFKTLKLIGQIATLSFTNSFMPFLIFLALAVATFFIVRKISSKKNAIISGIGILYVWTLLNYAFKIFNKEFTFDYLNVIHTTIVFALMCLFFFLLVRRLFSMGTALLATTILAFMPAYLFRTMGGVADHDATGMMFFMLIIYLYIAGWQAKKSVYNILFGVSAGLATLGMFATWPGGGNFLYLIFGAAITIEVILNILKKSDVYVYVSWFMIWAGAEIWLGFLNIQYLLGSFTTLIATLGFVLSIVHYLLFLDHRLHLKRILKIEKITMSCI
ncbi:glycosyltransferase family 39 protein, partial [Candidatus Woesearchaeota archaeon]|nr:glycosyltransferase family 39 protein [Candidatus Woesearchaeota archaeon]